MGKSGAKVLLDEYPLLVLPTLAKAVGLHEAILLQQIHYWLMTPKVGEEHDGRRWMFNSARQWTDQIPFLSEDQIGRATVNLRKMGLLLTGNFNKKAYDRTLWYSIDYDALEALLSGTPIPQICGMDVAELRNGCRTSAEPIPETTRDYSETTIATSSLRSDVGTDDDLPFSEAADPPKKKRVKGGPAVQLHWEKTGRRLNSTQITLVNEAVPSDEDSLALWGKVLLTWRLHGYNDGNVPGLLAWFKNGIPEMGKPPKKRNPSRETDYSKAPKRNLDAEPVERWERWERPGDLF